MDQERFDTLTRTLAAGLSRRGVLRTLSAVAAGGVAAVVGGGNVAEGKCKKKNRCGKGKHRTCCKNGKICIKGECVTACEPDCANKCGGVSDGCTGTCDNACACEPDCANKCGGVSDGCDGTCDNACCVPDCKGFCDGRNDGCGGTCDACSYPCGCQTSAGGVKFCSNGGYCRPCTNDGGCAVAGDPTAYYCVDHGIDICGGGYTTTCMTVTC